MVFSNQLPFTLLPVDRDTKCYIIKIYLFFVEFYLITVLYTYLSNPGDASPWFPLFDRRRDENI